MNANISLTSSAVSHIKSMLQAAPEFPGIRLGVKASGCSGLSYVLDFIKEERPNDCELNLEDIRILIDSKSLRYLQDMEIDCVQEGLNQYLKFNNPNVKGECGCGESFTVQDRQE